MNKLGGYNNVEMQKEKKNIANQNSVKIRRKI